MGLEINVLSFTPIIYDKGNIFTYDYMDIRSTVAAYQYRPVTKKLGNCRAVTSRISNTSVNLLRKCDYRFAISVGKVKTLLDYKLNFSVSSIIKFNNNWITCEIAISVGFFCCSNKVSQLTALDKVYFQNVENTSEEGKFIDSSRIVYPCKMMIQY